MGVLFLLLLFHLLHASQLPSWVSKGVIYGIAPLFMNNDSNGTLKMVQNRLPELSSLGVSILWIQPIFPNHNGDQAYDVTDYFSVWTRLGDFNDVRNLVNDAHALNMKVILDIVLDHTSSFHPFAMDVQKNGNQSMYRSFYMDHEVPGFGDMQHVETIENGKFVYFFDWPYLLNVNYTGGLDYMRSALEFWISKFDIDGYRCDAMWGILMRNLNASKELVKGSREARKQPIFMLAESGAGGGNPLVSEADFDAAYDWGVDIGHWAWNEVLGVSSWSNLSVHAIQQVVQYSGDTTVPLVRFIENNDQQRFLSTHTIQQTRAAAILMFTLPGIPMMYYGQEVGMTEQFPSFDINRTIQSYDHDGWWNFYTTLISARRNLIALHSGNFLELNSSNSSVYVFVRQSEIDSPVITVFNTMNDATTAQIAISQLNTNCLHWRDLITLKIVGDNCGPRCLVVSLDGYQALLMIPDCMV